VERLFDDVQRAFDYDFFWSAQCVSQASEQTAHQPDAPASVSPLVELQSEGSPKTHNAAKKSIAERTLSLSNDSQPITIDIGASVHHQSSDLAPAPFRYGDILGYDPVEAPVNATDRVKNMPRHEQSEAAVRRRVEAYFTPQQDSERGPDAGAEHPDAHHRHAENTAKLVSFLQRSHLLNPQ
jgi:hypothetical protein